MLALLSGDPGAGKTFLSLAIAADLSRGRLPASGERCEPISTLYMSNENPPEYVVRPRFDTQGGDPARLHILRGSLSGEGKNTAKSAFTFEDTDVLNAALKTTKANLVIIDPLQSYLGSDTDFHRANETRPLLDGLAEVAEGNAACILLLRHLNKGTGGKAMYRGLGTIDFTGAARMEMLAGSDSEESINRALIPIKNNIAPRAARLGYTIHGGETARLEWTGVSDLTPEDLLGLNLQEASRSETDLAADYLRAVLSDGPRPQQWLVSNSGFGERTLQRAFNKIGGKRFRDGERGPWMWGLPCAYPTAESILVNAVT